MSRTDRIAFEWRVTTGRWRWLLLGSLGVAANACWAEAEKGPSDPEGSGHPTEGPGPEVVTNTGGSSGHTTAVAVPAASRCVDPTPLGGGWEKCANGLVHRAEQGQCNSALPRAEGIAPDVLARIYPNYVAGDAGTGAEDPSGTTPGCLRDSDCTEHPFGFCAAGNYGEGFPGVFCQYGCVTDADCNPDLVCVCGDPVGQCVQSTCSTDAECEGGGMCASVTLYPGCPTGGFACQTPRDTCVTTDDCAVNQTCTVDDNTRVGPRSCSDERWACGRPFLIDGAARLAAVEQRSDWYPALHVDAFSRVGAKRLADTVELSAAVEQGWIDQALMEHASVAAFARFSLQLLGLGAPAELVQECARAMQDEIGHARDCFALARRHGTRDVGPGPLALTGALGADDLRSIVLGTIAEGCIGESLAALEAAEARAHCTDAAARAVLERIAADETRHAQLAWRFVAWALEMGPASLRSDVREAFARELSACAVPEEVVPSELDQRLLRHGLMGAGMRAALRRRVLVEVIEPCAEALLRGVGLSAAPSGEWLPEHTPV